METYQIVLLALLIIGIGNLIQTFRLKPDFFDRFFDFSASKITIAGVLLVASAIFVLLFLKQLTAWNREGFQQKTAMDMWKEITTTYPLDTLCQLKKRVEDKAFKSFKGAGADQLSDIQAQERVDKVMSENTTHGSFNCLQFEKLQKAKDIDSFFQEIQEIPSVFLIQAYETAERLHFLLQKQVKNVEDSLKEVKTEGFISPSVGICPAEVIAERRKFLRQKKLDEAAQRCLLPEEVPFEQKDAIAKHSVNRIQDTFQKYLASPRYITVGALRVENRNPRPIMFDVVTEALKFEARLNEIQEQAQSGTLLEKAAA